MFFDICAFFCVDNESSAQIHACMKIWAFDEYPSTNDEVMRCGYHYLNREGNLLDCTKCNEPSAQIHACMKICTFGEYPTTNDEVMRCG